MIKKALSYARAGLPVIPLHHPFHGGCSCGRPSCSSPAKHPLVPRGIHEATTDIEQIKAWWTKWPHANIGMLTSNVCVLDVDFHKGGEDSLRKMTIQFGNLPKTWTSVTGSGGRHFFFKTPKDEVIKNAVNVAKFQGIDFRGHNGYVVAPGSTGMAGEYQWLVSSSVPLAPIPPWLLRLLRQGIEVRQIRREKYMTTEIDIGKFDRIPEGQRNDGLARLAGILISSGKSNAETNALLHTANMMLCEPPLYEKEVDAIHASIVRCERRNGGG